MAKHFKGDKGTRDDKDRALAAAVAPRGNVFTRFTLRSLRANRVRTTVTIVGVALATGLLMAVLASVTSLHAAIVNYMRSTDGVWQESFDYTDDATLGNLRTLAGDHLDRLATRRDLGAVALSEENAEYAGAYLGIYDLPVESANTPRAAGDTDYAVYPTPELDEGRLPEKPGEIALPAYLRGETLVSGASQLSGVDSGATSEGELELGSEVTLAAGRRVWASEPETPIKSGALFQVEYSYETGEDGSINEGKTVLETLTDVGEARTYTVVGFVNTSYSDGNVAYVSPDEPAMTASESAVGNAFFSTTGYASEDELDQLMVRLLGEDGSWATNSSLLMYQGLDTGRQITTSLVLFAGVLAAVIVVAAVSLISNAFRISISERTRQFGLLASLGASRQQLRRTVYVEAGIIGLIGIPIGVALGIGGAAVAFALTAEGWSMIVGNGVTVGLVLRPLDAVAAIALGALALLVSALAPAVRASSVSAVDAIRQTQDVRPSKRLLRVFRRRRTAMDDFSADGRRPRGLAARLGGMPAFLARRTLAVSAGKSRASAMALAVSVALLVTAGLVSDYLSGMTSYIDYGGSADMQMWVSMSETSSELADSPAAVNMNDITTEISRVSGVKEGSASGIVRTYGSVHVDPAGVNWDAVDAYDASSPYGGFQMDREGYGSADFYLVDDATWHALAADLGLSGDAADPEHASCVAFNRVSTTNESTYGTVEPFTGSAETIDVLLADLADNQWLGMNDDGIYGLRERNEDATEVTFVSPASELGLQTMSVPVVACTDDLGESFPIGSTLMAEATGLTFVMPASAVFGSELESAMSTSIIQYFASFVEGADENAVTEGIQEAFGARGDIDTVTINNLRESLREYNAMIFTVNVFLYCFIAITMAIAVANVFNTIASGLMLRTREFAALQSMGMGRRAFRRMIFLECADFAVKGLVGGVMLATLVNWGFFAALSSSISTLTFEMPWGHVALAFAVVAVVLAASAGYALHKTHAMNLVEALRADAL